MKSLAAFIYLNTFFNKLDHYVIVINYMILGDRTIKTAPDIFIGNSKPQSSPNRNHQRTQAPSHDQIEIDALQKLPIIHPKTEICIAKNDPSLSILSRKLKHAQLYSHVQTNWIARQKNTSGLADVPSDISRLASLTGINHLQENAILPRHIDMAPAFAGRNSKKYLRLTKSKLFPIQFKADRGTLFDGAHYSYVPKFAKQDLVPRPNLIYPKVDESNSEMLSNVSPYLRYFDHEEGNDNREVPGWVIYINQGAVETDTPAYRIFAERLINLNLEPFALWIIEQITRLMSHHAIPKVIVNCETVIEICYKPISYPIHRDMLLDCIFNKKEVMELMKKPGQKFLHKEGKHLAALVIQFHYRHYRTRYTDSN